MSKKERETWEFERGLKNFFSLCSNPSEDNIISALRPSLKTGVENYIFWSEIRSGFGEPGGTHQQELSGVLPQPGSRPMYRLDYL